jgi:hypothetical protein
MSDVITFIEISEFDKADRRVRQAAQTNASPNLLNCQGDQLHLGAAKLLLMHICENAECIDDLQTLHGELAADPDGSVSKTAKFWFIRASTRSALRFGELRLADELCSSSIAALREIGSTDIDLELEIAVDQIEIRARRLKDVDSTSNALATVRERCRQRGLTPLVERLTMVEALLRTETGASPSKYYRELLDKVLSAEPAGDETLGLFVGYCGYANAQCHQFDASLKCLARSNEEFSRSKFPNDLPRRECNLIEASALLHFGRDDALERRLTTLCEALLHVASTDDLSAIDLARLSWIGVEKTKATIDPRKSCAQLRLAHQVLEADQEWNLAAKYVGELANTMYENGHDWGEIRKKYEESIQITLRHDEPVDQLCLDRLYSFVRFLSRTGRERAALRAIEEVLPDISNPNSIHTPGEAAIASTYFQIDSVTDNQKNARVSLESLWLRFADLKDPIAPGEPSVSVHVGISYACVCNIEKRHSTALAVYKEVQKIVDIEVERGIPQSENLQCQLELALAKTYICNDQAELAAPLIMSAKQRIESSDGKLDRYKGSLRYVQAMASN